MVKKGQVLVRLEDKEYIQLQQDYLSAKNALAFAKLDFDRQSELSKNQAASDKVLQQADEKMKQQQILVKSLAEKLRLINVNPTTLSTDNLTSQINIVAPASGMITDIMVNTGKYVQSGDAMVTVVASEGAKLALKAFEKDLPYLRSGQKVITYSNIQPDKKMNAIIENIVNQVGPEGFANVICNISNSNSNIVPGMYLNADVEAQSIDSWTILDEAIVTFEGKEYVYIDKGNKNYEMVEIQAGQREKGRTQIINFESIVNKSIVSKGAYTLLMKMKNVEE
jgi:cobalt-zinc-cadmium efflux system membrane fusion protein